MGCFPGNVWIYGAYSDFDADNSKEDDDYCHPTLYLFAFWIMTTTYIIMLVSCTCCVCVGALVGLCGNSADPALDHTPTADNGVAGVAI